MSAWANIGGTWRKGVFWENVGGTWRKLTPWLNVAGTWRKDPASSSVALTAVASPSYVQGASNGKPAATNQTTVTPVGGVAPYTYAWSEGADMFAASPTSMTTAFRGFPPGGGEFSEDFTCTVTDARGATAVTNAVSAIVSNYGGGGFA